MNDLISRFKVYALQVIVPKYTPMMVMGIGTAAAGLWAAHAGLLEQFGVTFTPHWPFVWPAGQEPSGPCILIELDTMSSAVITAIVGLVVVAQRATEHHAIGPITAKLQAAGTLPPDVPK